MRFSCAMNLQKIISIVEIVISALLVIAILLQQRGAGASAIMGGGGASYYTKRGFEKILFVAIIVLAVLFILGALASMYITAKY